MSPIATKLMSKTRNRRLALDELLAAIMADPRYAELQPLAAAVEPDCQVRKEVAS